MPARPCLRCGGTFTGTGSYCPRHQPSRRSAARKSGGAQASFRRKTLAKTGGRCAVCGSTDRVEAHHPHGLAAGGTHAQQGIPLCWTHHRAAERAARRTR